jgi:hypothetical protein
MGRVLVAFLRERWNGRGGVGAAVKNGRGMPRTGMPHKSRGRCGQWVSGGPSTGSGKPEERTSLPRRLS